MGKNPPQTDSFYSSPWCLVHGFPRSNPGSSSAGRMEPSQCSWVIKPSPAPDGGTGNSKLFVVSLLPCQPSPKRWSLREWLEASKLCVLLASEISPPASESWENTIYVYLLLRLFWWGAMFVKSLNSSEEFSDSKVGRNYSFDATKRVIFTCRSVYRKLEGNIPNNQQSTLIRWSCSRNHISECGEGRARCHCPRKASQWVHPGASFSKSSVRFTFCSGFLKGGCLPCPLISGCTFLNIRRQSTVEEWGWFHVWLLLTVRNVWSLLKETPTLLCHVTVWKKVPHK